MNKMNTYRVTLNFTFQPHRYYDDEDYSDEDVPLPNQTKKESKEAKNAAFRRTDAFYNRHNILNYFENIENYVKTFSALGFVETLWLDDDELKGAEWDAERFAIHMTVETDKTPDDIREELEMNSLEDGEYEACCETGWILFTRLEGDKVWDGDWTVKDVWEYGLTDYRDNPIDIVKMEETKQESKEE
jgi:hypothetical protein